MARYAKNDGRRRDLYRANYQGNVQNTLEKVVFEEKNNILGHFPLDANSTPHEIFHWFLYSERFAETYDRAMSLDIKNVNGVDRRYFKGRLFQDLCYLYYSNVLPKEITLLSPERTLAFFSKIYPRSQKYISPYGLNSLSNVPVPDGVVVGELYGRHGVISVFEYSCNSQMRHEDKISSFLNKQIPGISPDATLLITVPEGIGLASKISSSDAVVVMEMPFMSNEFSAFFGRVDEARMAKLPLDELQKLYLEVFLPDYELAPEEPSITSQLA